MKKTTITLLSLLFFCMLSAFAPGVKHRATAASHLSARKTFFAGISGPTYVSASGGPYTYTAYNLPVGNIDPPVWIFADPVRNEQFLSFPAPDGTDQLVVDGSVFGASRGSQTIWISDGSGILASINIFVTP
jgi:hypothetical protein